MKKLFTLFSVSALFLMLLFPVSVKADTEISFALPSSPQPFQWTTQEDDCAGNITSPANVVTEGAFVWSGSYYSAVERKDDTWTGVGSGSKCCTRNLVPFAASTYTITLVTKRLSDNVTMTLPVITVQQGTPSTHYAATAQWDKDGVLQTEDVSSSHQFFYTDASDKKSRDKEVTLTYTNVVINAAGNYQISIDFPSGDKDKYLMKTLTIISSNPSYNVTVTADGSKGSVSGAGLKEQGSLVELSVSEEEGFAFNGWTSVSGVVLTGHLNDNPLSFTMPGNAVSLTADFTTTTCSKSKTIQCENYDNSYTPGSSVPGQLSTDTENRHAHDDYPAYHGSAFVKFGESSGEIYYPIELPASTYTFSVICANGQNKYFCLYNSEGIKIHEQQLSTDDWWDPWHAETTSAWTLDAGTYYIGLYANNNWAVFDQITITASTNIFCNYSITMEDGVNGGDPTADAETAREGDVITVTAGEPASGYYFSGWSASPSVTFSDASVSPATFTMPANNVTITANYSAIVSSEFTYIANGEGTITCATESGSSVVSGTEIEMTAAVTGTGYVFRGWTATAGTFSDATALTTTFTMPAEAATVTATFAQVDNIISQGSETGSEGYHSGATMTESHIDDFGTFGHVVLMLSYSDMTGGNHHGWNIGKNSLYNSANSAGATGFGFYYKTETDEDKVAFCFDHGDQNNQYKVELPATNNVWKYHYFDKSAADGWNGSNIIIYLNGTDGGNTTANANGAIYLADIAATSITSKPEIASYIYTRDISGAGYGTLCLPMAGTVEGATLFSVAGKQEENSKLYVVLQEEPDLVGGQPYIFEKTADELRATMSGPQTPSPATVNGLVGTYVEISPLTKYDESHKNYILAKNGDDVEFRKVGDNVTVGEYRAYINLDGVPAYSPSQAIPGRRYVMMGVSGTQETEDTEDISAVEEVESGKVLSGKILVNGQLYLMYEGKMYDVRGARVK